MKSYIIVILLLIITGAGLLFLYNSADHSIIGSNSNGFVTKDVYSHYGSDGTKIVYGIPEWHRSIEAFLNSYSLIDSSFKVMS